MNEDIKCDIKEILEDFTKNPKDRKKILNILEICLIILSVGMAIVGSIYVYEWKNVCEWKKSQEIENARN